MEKYDLIVIGSGPGGYPAAIRAAQLGAEVAIIEKEALGGVCLNSGCIPTKTLIATAGLYWAMRQSSARGLKAAEVTFDYGAILANKNAVVATLQKGIAQLLLANRITLYSGEAAFLERNSLSVRQADGSSIQLAASRLIIASGSFSHLPDWLPQSKRVLDSRAFLELAQLPASLIVLGGGVIGCELACLAAQLGVQVSIVEILNDILPNLDDDLRAPLRRHMEKELKIRVLAGQPASKLSSTATGIQLQIADQTLEAELLLAALGRRPLTQGLALDKAGVALNPANGAIVVDQFGQTSAATIYAVGDVCGGVQLAHLATAQGLVAAEHALGRRGPPASALVPACIFSAPEVASVGLSERAAREQKRAVLIGKFPFQALGRALAGGATLGFAKWIVDQRTDQLLGAQVVGAQATELIAEATSAIQAELTASELANTIHAHPTLAEIWMEAARAVHGQSIHTRPNPKKTAAPQPSP